MVEPYVATIMHPALRPPPITHPVILSLDGTDDTTPFNQPPPTFPTATTPFTLPENWEFREQATEKVFRRFVSLFIRFMEDAAGFAVMHFFKCVLVLLLPQVYYF